MKEKIRECLEIIQYNPEKHKNLKSCLFEILNKDEYDKIMRGIITNSELLQEVRNILQAYEFLKANEEEMMLVIENMNDSIVNDTEVYDEVFFYYDEKDSCYHVMKKDRETGKYNEIHVSHFVSVGDNFFTTKINSRELLCNFQGEKLKTLSATKNIIDEDIFMVTDQIVAITQSVDCNGRCKNKSCYIKLEKTKDNKFKQLTNPDENVDRILSSKQVDDVSKNYIFDITWSGKKIDYGIGKNKKIEIINNYVYVIGKNGEVSYFTLDGKQIISTDKDDYFYIGRLTSDKENRNNIVVVGKYDKNLEKKYNYYDLDNHQELSKQNFSTAHNWTNYGAVVYTPELAIIRENKKITLCNSEGIFPIIDSPVHDNKQMIARSVKKWKKNIYIVEFVVFDQNKLPSFDDEKEDLNDYDFCCKNTENVCKQVTQWNYKDTKVYALIKDIYTSPQRIGNYFAEYRMFDEKSDCLYVIPASYCGRSSFNFRILDIDGNEMDIIRRPSANNKQISKSTIKNINDVSKLPFNNSAFLLPDCSEIKKEKLIALKKQLVNSEYLNKEISEKTEESFCYSWFEGIYPKILIRNIRYIGKDNAVIVEVCDYERYAYDKFRKYYNIAVNPFGKPIHFDKAVPISMDGLGNIIMSVSYGDGQRYILVNSNGEILINFAEDIISNNKGLYIVSRNGKCQLYDLNGVSMTVATDKQEWVKKYYINSCGVIRDVQERLLITNSGYKYLVDDEGDITIKENKEYSKVLQKIMYLDKNTYEEGE